MSRFANRLMITRRSCGLLLAAVLLFGVYVPRAEALTSVTITATTEDNASGDISVSGVVPLGVTFTAAHDGSINTTFDWAFGDGLTSTASSPTHVYNVAGTYVVSVTLTDGSTASDTITVIVTGPGEGPLTPNVNFRLAPKDSTVKLIHAPAPPNKDSFTLHAFFSTVDLPPIVDGLFLDFSINGVSVASGNLNVDGNFVQRATSLQSGIVFNLDRNEQTFFVHITNANLHNAFGLSGMGNADVPKGTPPFSVDLKLTLGSETYEVTIGYSYVSNLNQSGKGTFKVIGPVGGTAGAVVDGLFVVSQCSALENAEADSHFFEIIGVLALPGDALLSVPQDFPSPGFSGFWKVQIGEYVESLPADRFRLTASGTILMSQPEREAGGIRSIRLNQKRRNFVIRTWELPAHGSSGTELPLKSENFVGFNLVLRLELKAGSPLAIPPFFEFQGVTTTRLGRRNIADALWQTGR